MNPFDLPPAGAPASIDVPSPVPPGLRRGRMALVAVLTAGLIGGGIAGISQLASADQPDLAAQGTEEPTDETVPPVDAPDDSNDTEPDERPTPPPPDAPVTDGKIVFDSGDDDPIVIDLGDVDPDALERLHECIGIPALDLPFGDAELGDWAGEFPVELDEFIQGLPFDLENLDGELGPFRDSGVFDGEGSVTIAGPDGVSIVDLGENGSVTVTKDGDDVTISTDGDATVSDLSDLFGEFGTIFDGEGSLMDGESFDDLFKNLPAFDELPAFEPLDPDAVRSCVDEVLGR